MSIENIGVATPDVVEVVENSAEDSGTTILNRFKQAISAPEVAPEVHADFVKTFVSIGMDASAASDFATRVMDVIKDDGTLPEIENKMQELFATTTIDGVPFKEKLSDAMRNRETIIVDQVSPFLSDVHGKVVDYGAGSGRVAQGLRDKLGIDVEGYEVSDFRHPSVSVPISQFDGRNVPVSDGHFEAAVITNVMHHEANNEDIIAELSRIVNRKVVVIETIPLDETAASRERCFATDAFWNRFFFNADVPVPGTYEMPEKWIERFAAHGWKCVHSENLGYDQPAVQDIHHLLVFEKV